MAGKMFNVSAGVLTCGEKILICQRRAGDRHGLEWEFPGGKVIDGEDSAACLQREISNAKVFGCCADKPHANGAVAHANRRPRARPRGL